MIACFHHSKKDSEMMIENTLFFVKSSCATLLLAALLSSAFASAAAANPGGMASAEPAAAIEAGLAAIGDEEFIKAANIFEQAVLANPADVDLNRYLGIGYYKSGRLEQAVKQLKKTLELAPGDVESEYALGVVHLARASEMSVMKVRGALKGSVRHLERAIELDPSHTAAHYYLIQVLISAPKMMGGNLDRAEELNEHLADLSPLHHRVVNSTLAAKRNDYAAAEALLLESHAHEPQSSLLNFAMLSHYHGQEEYGKAIRHGEMFLTAPKIWDDTDVADAHFLLAQSYQHEGDQRRSLHHYAQTLAHSDSKKVIEQVQAEVKKIADSNEN